MTAKIVLFFCAQAVLAQHISSQCIGATWNSMPYAAEAWAPAGEWTCFTPAACNGGGFQVTSSSPIGVTGLKMTSENAYEGQLTVCGSVPFLGAVALEGTLPTAGVAAVTYGCGTGEVAILNEDIGAGLPYAGPYGYGPAEMGYGYPMGFDAMPGPPFGFSRGMY